MIDFANLKYLEIPEGEVVEVKRGDELLWSKPSDTKPYKELLYLESTGTQYIDTGVIGTTANTGVEVEWEFSNTNENMCIFSSRNGQTSYTFTLFWLKSSSNRIRFDANGQKYFPSEVNTLEKQRYRFSYFSETKAIASLDNLTNGISQTMEVGKIPTFSSKSLYLFASVNVGTVFSSIKMYSFKLYEGDTLVRDMIPVLDADNTPCMFDKVSHQFFYNSGTGEFKYGEIIDTEYESIEYLESTGKEFIDTEMTISTSTDTVECIYESIEDVKYKWIFGEHDTNARFGVGTGDGSNQRNVAYGTGTAKVGDSYIFNNPHTFLADTSGVYIDGNKITNFKSFSSTSTIYLFNLNLNGNDYCNKARIYSYKHWRDGELVRDMIPVKRLLDGEAGLYDRANKMFYPLFSTFNLRREKTEEEMYQMWLEDTSENGDDFVVE